MSAIQEAPPPVGAAFLRGMSPDARNLLAGAESAGHEAQALVRRALDWCERAGLEGRDFTHVQAWALGHLMPQMTPGAWSGLIPPVTRAGRHRRIDEYVLRTPWRPAARGGVFADIGCGFPPLTTVDTADALGEGWQVVGADPHWHPFLLTEADGRYACLNAEGEPVYFQTRGTDLAGWLDLVANAPDTRARYRSLISALRPALDCLGSARQVAVERDGVRLERDPQARFERENLRFVRAGLLDIDEGPLDIARCFNVLIFFGQDFRREAFEHLARQVRPGGLFLCGADWAGTSTAHYSVYRHEGGSLVLKEFAFGIDNVRPVTPIPFITFADSNPEVGRLACVVSVLRKDETFRRGFDEALDRILAKLGVCPRGPDGSLGGVPPDASAEWFESRTISIELELAAEGWVREAVAALRRHGVDAWVNCVGHIAVGSDSVLERSGEKP